MDRFLKGAGGTISITILSANRQPINADGVVGVTIRDGAGAIVVDDDPATPRAASTGIYDYNVTGAQASSLDVFTDLWTATVGGDDKVYTTHHEVVGAFIFSLQELQELDPKLDDTAKYPTPKLLRARERAEELFESETGISFRPRGSRVILDGSGNKLLLLKREGKPLWLPTRVVSGSIDPGSGGVVLTGDEITGLIYHRWGALERKNGLTWYAGANNVGLHVEHGLSEAPATVAAECAKLALSYLVSRGVPDRAVSMSAGDDTFRMVTADEEGHSGSGQSWAVRPTGIPSVDRVLNSLRIEVPAVG